MGNGSKGGTISQDVFVALNADVVSYSRLLADDPTRTAEAMSSARAIVTREIADDRGRAGFRPSPRRARR